MQYLWDSVNCTAVQLYQAFIQKCTKLHSDSCNFFFFFLMFLADRRPAVYPWHLKWHLEWDIRVAYYSRLKCKGSVMGICQLPPVKVRAPLPRGSWHRTDSGDRARWQGRRIAGSFGRRPCASCSLPHTGCSGIWTLKVILLTVLRFSEKKIKAGYKIAQGHRWQITQYVLIYKWGHLAWRWLFQSHFHTIMNYSAFNPFIAHVSAQARRSCRGSATCRVWEARWGLGALLKDASILHVHFCPSR